MARLLTARGRPRLVAWIKAVASSLNSGPDRPASCEVVGDVAGGLLAGHAGHGVADGDALVEGGEDAEFDPPPQGGLADEQAGERAAGVEVVVGEHADGLELGGFEHVCLVDGQDGDAAAFVVLAGEQVHGLGGEGGVVGFGDAAECGDDGVVDAADADGGVAEVDEGVPGGVEGGEGGAQGDGFPGADFAGDDAEGVLADAPADPGGCLGVRGVAVQHAWGQVTEVRDGGDRQWAGCGADHVAAVARAGALPR